MHGVSEEVIANIVPESRRDRAFRPGKQDTSGQSIAEALPAHDAETINSSKAQYRLGKLVNRVRYNGYVASLEQLPETTPPRGKGDPNGEKETRSFAKARQRIQSGPGATVFLRARPRLVQSHPSVGFCIRGTTFSGDGVSGNEVTLLRRNGRKRVARTIASSIGRAGRPAPTPGPRALPQL